MMHPVDWALVTLARTIAVLTGWSPDGRRISVRLTEGDPSVVNRVSHGTSRATITAGAGHAELALLIDLDEPFARPEYPAVSTTRIVAKPRYAGHGPFRLLFASAVVNLYDAGSAPLEDFDERSASPLGVASLRLS